MNNNEKKQVFSNNVCNPTKKTLKPNNGIQHCIFNAKKKKKKKKKLPFHPSTVTQISPLQ